jgi:SWI/SNF-related matrix-associated actin-dependent regulator of chromatin subfamily A3
MDRGIVYSRIDGAVPAPRRSKIIDDFQHNPEMAVLLMTIGTGAVGYGVDPPSKQMTLMDVISLNLTAANRVHLLEPQWNPSVEEQAIGRALRLGQTRAVTVVRYVMHNTVEQVFITKIEIGSDSG